MLRAVSRILVCLGFSPWSPWSPWFHRLDQMSVTWSGSDLAFMARALALTERGRDTCTPNPNVGCVLAKDGRVIGEGWHERAGEAHAEARALAAATESPEGATAYVTLEPCAHHGRTGPCAEALVKARVARVV